MNDILAFLAAVVPMAALISVITVLLRALGPVDLTALLYAPREDTWPRGVQEEDPPPWHFAARQAEPPAEPPDDPTGTAPRDRPPVILAALDHSTHLRPPRVRADPWLPDGRGTRSTLLRRWRHPDERAGTRPGHTARP